MIRFTPARSTIFALSALASAMASQVMASDAPVLLQRPELSKEQLAPVGVIVKFKANHQVTALHSGTTQKQHSREVPQLSAEIQAVLDTAGATVTASYPLSGLLVVKSERPVSQVIDALQRSGEVLYAVPDYQRQMQSTFPNDEFFSWQWGLHDFAQYQPLVRLFGLGDRDINAPEAWDIRTDASNVVVAVLDSGIDYSHERDLSDNMWRNPGEIPDNWEDDDNNGYIDDVYGIAPIDFSSDPADTTSHGTLVAGMIGAKGNNTNYGAGVAWSTQLMALKVVGGRFNTTSDSAIIEAIEYLIQTKTRLELPRVILNISIGGFEYSEAVHQTLAAASEAGILIVAAAGNNDLDNGHVTFYPATDSSDNLISVGASATSYLGKEQFSNYGCSAVDLMAPGEWILGPLVGSGVAIDRGTSYSAALTSGVAALVWAEHPDWDWSQVKSTLMNSSLPSADMQGLSISEGILRADKALSLQGTAPSVWQVTPSLIRPGSELAIQGRTFGATKGEVIALVNGQEVPLVVSEWADKQIKVQLPEQFPYGLASVKVKASNSQWSGQSCMHVSDSYEQAGSLATPRSEAVTVQLDDKAWIIGGRTPFGTTATVEQFDLKTARSTSDTSWMMPIPTRAAAAAALNGKIYVVGGMDDKKAPLADLQVFDPKAGSWSKAKAMPEALAYSSAVVLNDKLYVFGGLKQTQFDPEAGDYTQIAYRYDPTTDIWSSLAPMPQAFWGGAATLAPNGESIIVSGGYGAAGLLKQVQLYNPRSNSWSELPSMLKGRARHSMITYNDVVYALNGAGEKLLGNKDGEYLLDGGWRQVTEASIGLAGVSAIAYQDKGYIFGGETFVSYGGLYEYIPSQQILSFDLADRPVQQPTPLPVPQPTANNSHSGSAGLFSLSLLTLAMVRRRKTSLAAALGLMASAMPALAEPANNTPPSPLARHSSAEQSGALIVKFKQNQHTALSKTTSATLSAESRSTLSSIKAKVSNSYAHSGMVRITTSVPQAQAIEELIRSGQVEFVVPDYQRKPFSTASNDTNLTAQWGLDNTGQIINGDYGLIDQDINAPEGWSVATNANNVIVAVLDDGIDLGHEDLADNIWTNPTEIPGNNLDDDKNGYVDDVYGIDTFAGHGLESYDDTTGYHGTSVAGVIGAKGNNGIGIAGVSWSTQLMNLRAMDNIFLGRDSNYVEAIEYLIETKQRLQLPRVILNASWGGPQYSPALLAAFQAAEQAGILIVAAAGNYGQDNDKSPMYPASFQLDTMVSATGLASDAEGVSFGSSFGCSSVDIAAPSEAILTTNARNLLSEFKGYGYAYGTSMSAAFVSGAAALVWEQNPYATALDVKAALLAGSQKQSGLEQKSVSEAMLKLDLALAVPQGQSALWHASPTAAGPGQEVTVRGHKLGSTAGKLVLQQGDKATELVVKSWSDTEIVATVPATVDYGSGQLIAKPAAGPVSNTACFAVAQRPVQIAEMAVPRADTAYAQVDDDLWVLGGTTYYGPTAQVEKFNLSSKKSVTDSAWMAPEAMTYAEAVVLGKKIYMLGGFDQDYQISDKVYSFDTDTKTWQLVTQLPSGLMLASAAVVQGKIYVIGGNQRVFPPELMEDISSAVHIYDPVADRWSEGPALPVPVANAGISVDETAGTITVLGGYVMTYDYDSFPASATVQLLNTKTAEWSELPAMLNPRHGMGVLKHKGEIYSLFGVGDPELGNWANGERLVNGSWQLFFSGSRHLSMPAVASNSHSGFVLGGYDNVYTANSQIWQFALPGAVAETPPVSTPPKPQPPQPVATTGSSGSLASSYLMFLVLLAGFRGWTSRKS